MKKLLYWLVLILIPLFHCYSSEEPIIDTIENFAKLIPDLNNTDSSLILNEPEYSLSQAYDQLRAPQNRRNLKRKAEILENELYAPVDRNNPGDQSNYLKTIRNMSKKLKRADSSVEPDLRRLTTILNERIDLSRIDEQKNDKNILKNLKDNNESITVVNNLTGRIFVITQKLDDPDALEETYGAGSGMFVKLENAIPTSFMQGDILNGVMTCAHVIEVRDDQRLTGVYFVPTPYLDTDSGLPKDSSVISSTSLMKFLKESPYSYKIDSYSIKDRKNKDIRINTLDIYNSKLTYNNNEDIIFGNTKNHVYNGAMKMNFNCIRNNKLVRFNMNEYYYAVGYPASHHYDIGDLEDDEDYDLIKIEGLCPLTITCAQAHHINSPLQMPRFFKGRISHEAPCAGGMSGGALMKINKTEIEVLGVTSSGIDIKEYGNY